VAAALARRTADQDDDVPELGPAAVEPVVQHDAAADPGPEREHDEVLEPLPGPELPFGERGGIRVVLDADRETEPRADMTPQVEVVERQVRRAQDPAGPPVEVRRNPEADAADAVVDQRLDCRVERLQHVLLGGAGAVHAIPGEHVSVAVDDAGEDLRPAHVDPDHERSAHGRGLP
jgi:hypothetical protein